MNGSCPITLSFNARRFLMDGYRGLLDFEFRNVAADEGFDLRLSLQSVGFPQLPQARLSIGPGGCRSTYLPLDLSSGTTNGSYAGEIPFQIRLDIHTAEDGIHRFIGEFILRILAKADSVQQVTVNIERLVEQHGSGGMGAINEIDMSRFIELPRLQSVNDLLNSSGEPLYVPIELDYDGTIETASPEPQSQSLARCTLINRRTGRRLHFLTDPAITLGRSRTKADIVTWVFPRTPENDRLSRQVSSQQCRLLRQNGRIWLEHLSRTNSTRLDDTLLEDTAPLPPDRAVSIRLASSVVVRVSPATHSAALNAESRVVLIENLTDPGQCWHWLAADFSLECQIHDALRAISAGSPQALPSELTELSPGCTIGEWIVAEYSQRFEEHSYLP